MARSTGGAPMSAGHHIRIRQQLGRFTLDVELQSDTGGVTAIFGPSGSGKTSLINAIAGLTQPQEAFIQIGDRVLSDTAKGSFVKPHERRVGYVFQDARLFPHLTVEKNLRYGAAPGVSLAKTTELLGIDHLLDRLPNALSGGEAQRVAIGRALLSQPGILLMDEPLASLDQARREELLPYLDQLHRFSGTQIFYVTHSMAEVARLADTIVLLKDGQVTRAGPAMDILSDPAALPDIGVREAGAVLQATLTKPDAGDGLSALSISDGTLLLPQIDSAQGAALKVRILASDIILSRDRPDGLSALNILPATVAHIQQGSGPGVAVALVSGQDRLVARITRRSARALNLTQGASCFAIIKSVSVAPGAVSAGPHQITQEE
jgi:molybdate transport system ATP-binding protein